MGNNGQGNNINRYRNPEQLLQENLLMQIPSDPQKEEIIEILSKNPSVMSYLQNIINELKNEISMKKLILDKKQNEYDELTSKSRMDAISKYKENMAVALLDEKRKIDNLLSEGFNKAEAKEIVKLQRPDKPTSSDLKDVAFIRNKAFYDNEVVPFKEEIVSLEKTLDEWKVKYNLFENNFKASQTIKGLLQNEFKY